MKNLIPKHDNETYAIPGYSLVTAYHVARYGSSVIIREQREAVIKDWVESELQRFGWTNWLWAKTRENYDHRAEYRPLGTLVLLP